MNLTVTKTILPTLDFYPYDINYVFEHDGLYESNNGFLFLTSGGASYRISVYLGSGSSNRLERVSSSSWGGTMFKLSSNKITITATN